MVLGLGLVRKIWISMNLFSFGWFSPRFTVIVSIKVLSEFGIMRNVVQWSLSLNQWTLQCRCSITAYQWTLSFVIWQTTSYFANWSNCNHVTLSMIQCWTLKVRHCMLNSHSATVQVDWSTIQPDLHPQCRSHLFILQNHSCRTLINEVVEWSLTRGMWERVSPKNSTAKVTKYKT